MLTRHRWACFRVVVCTAFVCSGRAAAAQGSLGTAQQFGVLGAVTVTNTNATTINGSLGVSPGSSITGLGTITLTGALHQTNAAAAQAQADARTAYVAFGNLLPTQILTGQDLGGLTLTPGVYSFANSAQLTGNLTLNFLGLPNASFVFLIGTALTTAEASSVSVINGNSSGGIFFRVGSSATLGSSTVFQGNILADRSITLVSTAKILCGRAIALGAAVTLDNNVVSTNCAGRGNYGSGNTDFGSMGYAGIPSTTSVVPEPSTMLLMSAGMVVIGLIARRKLA